MNKPRPILEKRKTPRDSNSLIRRLEREITCLERQLERLVMLDGTLDKRTHDTYQDMIVSRREMLSDLGF